MCIRDSRPTDCRWLCSVELLEIGNGRRWSWKSSPRSFGVQIKMFSLWIYVLVSANLPSDVGVVSLVQFRCCIRKIGVVISQVHFCRLVTFLVKFYYWFIWFKCYFHWCSVLYNVSSVLLYVYFTVYDFKNVFYWNSRFSLSTHTIIRHYGIRN